MFKAIRISVLLLILFMVAMSNWLTQARSTDWNNSLWVKIYPVNADGSKVVADYIATLTPDRFSSVETFIAREVERYGVSLRRPVRMELGKEVHEQPPSMGEEPNPLNIMWWSLKMRWWASDVTEGQDNPDPDVRIFVRYHKPLDTPVLENSVGLQKGMVGIVNAYAGRLYAGSMNVIVAHEFLHTLGATDKYQPGTGLPIYPDGFAEPERTPRFPQRYAEIMGGRIPKTSNDAEIPNSLRFVTIGEMTAREIRLID